MYHAISRHEVQHAPFRPGDTYITGGDCIGPLTFFQKVSSQLSRPPVRMSRPPQLLKSLQQPSIDVNNIASPWKMMKHAILNLFFFGVVRLFFPHPQLIPPPPLDPMKVVISGWLSSAPQNCFASSFHGSCFFLQLERIPGSRGFQCWMVWYDMDVSKK